MKRFSLFLLINYILLTTSAQINNIVLVDVSGSMDGYGVNSHNVLQKVQPQVDRFVTFSIQNDWNTQIIPFSDKTFMFDSVIFAHKGNTDIYNAIQVAQANVSHKLNNIFIISDGEQNIRISKDSLCSVINDLKGKSNDSIRYFFVALSSSIKNTQVAKLFDGKQNFVLLDSLYLPSYETYSVKTTERFNKGNTVDVTSHETSNAKTIKHSKINIAEDDQTDGSAFNWLLLLILLLIILLLVIIWYSVPNLKLLGVLPILNILSKRGSRLQNSHVSNNKKEKKEKEKEESEEDKNENIFFQPFVGNNYGKGLFGKRIMVLGESHYCDKGCIDCGKFSKHRDCMNFTNNVMHDYLDKDKTHEKWMNTFKKFERSLVGYETDVEDSERIWNSVLFYNYLQVAMGGPREAGTAEQYQRAEAALFEIFKKYQPDYVIVWGKRLHANMPSIGLQDRPDIIVDGNHIVNGIYTPYNIKVIVVNHPSVGYSWDYWHRAICEFLKEDYASVNFIR